MNFDRPIFTSREIAALSGRPLSSVSTTLKTLQEKKVITRIVRGVWANEKDSRFDLLSVVPFLTQGHQTYISFITALHLHGIISQIPKVIYAASTMHTKIFKTSVATYSIHQISPPFFDGFDWHKGKGNFLIAAPEKALIDSLYLSSRRSKRFRYFPELSFSKDFSFKKARKWTELSKEQRIRRYVLQELKEIQRKAKKT
jgi:predicted transcriptional regulator of viral defense system